MIRPHGLGSRLGLTALACARDTKNAIRYGAAAPRFAERVWIDPRQVSRVVRDPRFRRPVSARVVDGDWDQRAMEIEQWGKFIACQRHWKEGVAWEDTGLIDALTERLELRGPIDGLSRPSDASRRYEELDEIYGRVQATSELLSMKELAMQTFRGWGDILIHVGRGPELLLGRGGQHRFSIARCLDLHLVPAQLGAIHPAVLTTWSESCIRSDDRPGAT